MIRLPKDFHGFGVGRNATPPFEAHSIAMKRAPTERVPQAVRGEAFFTTRQAQENRERHASRSFG